MVFKPDASKGIEVFVDAYFAGERNRDVSNEPSSVLSRTGFVIKCCNCPIFWVSKLQTEITLSTTEAEYVALSHAMRETLPFIGLAQEINTYLKLNDSIEHALTKCTVFLR